STSPSPLAGVAQLVEHHLAKVDVESSSLFARSIFPHPKRMRVFSCPESWTRGTGTLTPIRKPLECGGTTPLSTASLGSPPNRVAIEESLPPGAPTSRGPIAETRL